MMKEIKSEEEIIEIMKKWINRIWVNERDRKEIFEELVRLMIELNVIEEEKY